MVECTNSHTGSFFFFVHFLFNQLSQVNRKSEMFNEVYRIASWLSLDLSAAIVAGVEALGFDQSKELIN